MNDLAKAVGSLVKCQDAEQMKAKNNQTQPLEVQSMKTVTVMGLTYRPMKVNLTEAKSPFQCQQYTPRSPKDQYHLACLIVVLRGEKIDLNYLNLCKLANLINNRLAQL